MTDRQHEAIKRLIVKQSLKGVSGGALMEYAVNKSIDSDNMRNKRLWITEANKIFDVLPKREQDILANGQ